MGRRFEERFSQRRHISVVLVHGKVLRTTDHQQNVSQSHGESLPVIMAITCYNGYYQKDKC